MGRDPASWPGASLVANKKSTRKPCVSCECARVRKPVARPYVADAVETAPDSAFKQSSSIVRPKGGRRDFLACKAGQKILLMSPALTFLYTFLTISEVICSKLKFPTGAYVSAQECLS